MSSPFTPHATPPATSPVSTAPSVASDATRADDLPLVHRAAQGDRAAFTMLVRRHQRGLFGFLGRMGITQAQAQDLAQECFLRVWRHLGEFDPRRAAFSTWLYTIARRLALNWLDRAEHTLRAQPGGGAGGGTAGPLGDEAADPVDTAAHEPAPGSWGDDPLQQLEQQRERAWLLAGMRRLPLADRSLLALAYVHDMSLAQIAQIEGVSEPAAKARLHRARGRLREMLVALDGDAQARCPLNGEPT
ncbi:MAG: sigma-70 family RNA polymerase sigma factor [Burkholderiales bacterium]|nr:sigma-70 family RNA polymerase sigma factor [Burkholderiales bacterium]